MEVERQLDFEASLSLPTFTVLSEDAEGTNLPSDPNLYLLWSVVLVFLVLLWLKSLLVLFLVQVSTDSGG